MKNMHPKVEPKEMSLKERRSVNAGRGEEDLEEEKGASVEAAEVQVESEKERPLMIIRTIIRIAVMIHMTLMVILSRQNIHRTHLGMMNPRVEILKKKIEII